MLSRTIRALILASLPLTGFGLVPSAGQAAGPVSSVHSAYAAVSAMVKPFYRPSNSRCNDLMGRFVTCPITYRLALRLSHPDRGGNMICRCQNPPRSVRLTILSNNGSVARVNTLWHYGRLSYTITFVVLHRHAGWLVDDTYCAGKPRTTTIYRRPVPPCR